MARFILSNSLFPIAAAALAVLGCSNADALVVITVDANPMLTGITSLHTTATVGPQVKEFDVPPATGEVTMTIPPQRSYGIVVPHKLGNMLTVHVDAMAGSDIV